VLTGVDSVAYATGHAPVIEAGPSPFAGGPTVALVGADGALGLVAPNVEAAAAAASWADERALYEGYAFEHPSPLHDNYLAAVRGLAARLGLGGTLAVEPVTFTAALAEALGGRTVDLTPALTRARMTKTAAELDLMRRSAEAAAVGQRAFLRAVRPGRTELAVFADIRLAIEELAGERVAFTGDFLSGRQRTAGFTGWPTDRVIEAGDPVIADLAPRLGGYWGDSCAGLVVGTPDERFRRQFRAAKGALEHALTVIRPGVTAAEVDREVRGTVERAGYRYPHHSGHSIGTAVHEFPRLVPYDTTPLEADMVLMVEPGAYDPEAGGVRTEWMIRVTPGGCEPLAPFEHVESVAVGGQG
jgi:Xaa-Pro aminopeptidase